ncbi:MAG: Do family serine endopeptidase [Pseudomonadota bacterium]
MHTQFKALQKSAGLRHVSQIALATGLLAASASTASANTAIADLVEDVAPAVVTVLSSRDPAPEAAGSEPFGSPEISPFEEFFRQFGRNPGQTQPFRGGQPREGLGSGFILSDDGIIVTNHHVIAGADEITIRLSDDRVFGARVIGTDQLTDLAVLQIDAGEDLPFVELGTTDDIRVGEGVVAVGNPFGLGGTVTSGIVSAKGRNISAGPYAEFIQTDAAINRGNSGGPLFNMEGDVVGVNSAIYSPTGGSVGVGFAIAADTVEFVVEDLLDDGAIERGWLGVSIQSISPDIALALGLEGTQGALVSAVAADGPSVGTLEPGDVILEFEDTPVASNRDLPRLVGAARIGAPAEIEILRDGARRSVSVTLGAFQSEEADASTASETADPAAHAALGATVAPLSETARAETGTTEDVDGLVITSLKPAGPADRSGLRVGDVIMRVGSAEIATEADLDAALDAVSAENALFLINRAGQQRFVAIELA